MNEEVQIVPLTALESQAQRDHQTMRYMAIGWCISIVITVFMSAVAVCCALSYEEELTETVEATQTAEDNGSNYFAGGDINGYATSGQEDDDENA